MNILIISHEYPPIGGGGANACRHLSKEYVKLGHTVTVVTAQYRDEKPEELVDGVRVIRVRAIRSKVDTSSFLEMFSYLISSYIYTDRLCKKERFDICQVFFGIPSGPIALHLKRKYELPYVVRFGGGDIPGAQKRFAVIYKILAPIIKSIWGSAKHLVANSEVLKNRALDCNTTYDIDIIPNGVDSEYFCRKNEYCVDGKIQMLFVSRLIEGKGLQYVIPRMKEINDRVGKTVTLTIVGDGPYRNKLERLINEDNKDYVKFVGRKEKDELLAFYEDANLFILPSLSEGMPNVVLEAMAMSLPVVMANCGGSKELINGNGVIAQVDEFVNRLVDVCMDSTILYAYSKESRQRAVELFSWEAKAKDNIRLFYE